MRVCIGILTGLFFLSSLSVVQALEIPRLVFESSDSLNPVVVRLKRIETDRLRESMHFVGLVQAGDPIRVIVASEQSDWAQRAPIWASGYALSRLGIIVLLPDRVVGYPYDSLENVLFHEVAHILTERAAQGQTIPRWLDEGIAMAAAHSWDLEDRARLTWATVTGNPISLEHLDSLFHKDSASAKQAYVLSYALVRYFIQKFGREWPRHMLASLAEGLSFEEAFLRTTFTPLNRAEAAFWTNQTVWTRWVPAVTSSVVLWVGILGLAFYAFKKQRQRAEALKRQWKEEDFDD